MMNIKNNDLENINGGISAWGIFGIGAAIVFAIGVIDGYIRPLKCNK